MNDQNQFVSIYDLAVVLHTTPSCLRKYISMGVLHARKVRLKRGVPTNVVTKDECKRFARYYLSIKRDQEFLSHLVFQTQEVKTMQVLNDLISGTMWGDRVTSDTGDLLVTLPFASIQKLIGDQNVKTIVDHSKNKIGFVKVDDEETISR